MTDLVKGKIEVFSTIDTSLIKDWIAPVNTMKDAAFDRTITEINKAVATLANHGVNENDEGANVKYPQDSKILNLLTIYVGLSGFLAHQPLLPMNVIQSQVVHTTRT